MKIIAKFNFKDLYSDQLLQSVRNFYSNSFPNIEGTVNAPICHIQPSTCMKKLFMVKLFLVPIIFIVKNQ